MAKVMPWSNPESELTGTFAKGVDSSSAMVQVWARVVKSQLSFTTTTSEAESVMSLRCREESGICVGWIGNTCG